MGGATGKDVGGLTMFFKEVVTAFFPGPVVPGSEDHVFKELLVTVVNQILLKMEDGNWSGKGVGEAGFLPRRVWLTAEAWKAKRKQYTMAEWIQKLVGFAKEAGVPVPEA